MKLRLAGLVTVLLVCLLVGCYANDLSDTPSVDNGIATGHSAQTDPLSREREEEAMRSDGYSIKERKFRENSQKFEFQAEVNRLMDIIINSLYSNKDVFLRELISNASDALDKIRFLSLTDKSVLGDSEDSKLEVRIKVDKDKNAIIIRDRGIGMTKDDLIKNLGTIAKSGTSAFLEQLQKGGDVNLIGQFGVGFYSVYLVADFVEVVTKHNDDKQYIWESKADGNFAISEDTDGEPLGRGTEIRIYLKEEFPEYLDEAKLKELVHKYSEFINFPIFLYTSKEVEKEVPEPEEEDVEEEVKEEETPEEEEKKEEDKEEEVEDEAEEEEEEEKEVKKVKETVWEWELLNENKAIWLRDAKDVTKEEYDNFYKAVGKAYDEPLAHVHFRGEGDVEFTAILYLPKSAPFDMYDSYYSRKPQVKLYVRRVFITDEMDDFLPKYLSFLVGLVDSDSLPLNVSREMLQQHASLKTIKKKIVRKALDMIKKLADAEKKLRAKQEGDGEQEEGEEEDEEAQKKLEQDAESYLTFWKEFGKALKLGIIEDTNNRNRLAKLMRFYTSKSGDKMTDLEEYTSRMKEGQKHIYYLTGTSKDELASSPFLEKLQEQDYEVIYFIDPLDEYLMNSLKEFEDREFMNASKEDLKIGSKKDKKTIKKYKEEFKDFNKWWKDAISDQNVDVKVSNRLSTTPCVVVTSKYGWTANMERIMKAQALSDPDKQSYMKAKRFLEINPRHTMIKEIKAKFEADAEDEGAKNLARVVYEAALLESGFSVDDVKGFNKRIYSLLKNTMGIEGSPDIVEEENVDEEETTEESGSADPTELSADDFAEEPAHDEL